MERKTKEQLKGYFEAPMPKGKTDFIKRLEADMKPQKNGIVYMLGVQLCYISKGVWLVSGVIFVLMLLISRYADATYVGAVYALIPFLVMISVTESLRSYRYGMYELELTCRYSLKDVVLGRLLILGLGNLILLLLVAAFSGGEMFSRIIYMLVPYLITAAGGLMLMRRFPDKEGNLMYFGFSALVALLECAITLRYSYIYEAAYLNVWMAVCAVCMVLLIREALRTIRMTEELAWN